MLVYATMCIAVLSFTVWLHHFFTMGASANVNAFFGIMTMIIAVPTGVKVYDWLLTMYRGRLRFDTPMLWSIAFIVTFVIGGMTGVILAIPPLDYVFHNTLFLIAHFHNMLIPGMLFGLFAGYAYWFPKATGFKLNEKWGRRAFVFWVAGFYLAFMPLYVLGFLGMSRRMAYYDQPEWQVYLVIAAIGALSILCGIICQAIQLVVSIRERASTTDFAGDPWDGQTLEWATSSPPPEYNFAVPPLVHSRDAFRVAKESGQPYEWPTHYEPIEIPRNSMTGVVLGAAGFVTGFAIVWHIWWLAAIGLLAIVGTVIARSFAVDTTRIISASEVAEIEGVAGRLRSSPARRPHHDRRDQPASGHKPLACPRGRRHPHRSDGVRLLGLSDERRDHLRAALCDLLRDGRAHRRRPLGRRALRPHQRVHRKLSCCSPAASPSASPRWR
ncbi:MAG: cbb3-type cytochrome c oxidase subunit I [Hyphomicrobium sp.]